MRNIPFERKVVGLLIIILLFVSASAALVYGNLNKIINEITEEARPDEKLIVMKEMIYDISDAENSVKSYSLTREPAYLDQFEIKTSEVDAKIQKLRTLSQENEQHLIYVDSLDYLTKNKFVILEDLLILQGEFSLEKVFKDVIKNVEEVETDNSPEEDFTNDENGEEKKGFFKRLKERREKRKEEKENDGGEEVEELDHLNQIEGSLYDLKEKELANEQEARERELELIQEDKLIMDRIMAIFSKMESEESQSMEESIQKADKESGRTKYLVLAFCILVTALLGFAGYAIFTYVKRNNAYKKALKAAKDETEQRNREVLDSIHYAQRIQTAILPDYKKVEKCIPDSFILYKPKDIVAGDFYWMLKLNNKVLLAVADCTGHGVPGAMVSVVCHNSLNRSVREFGLVEPAKILEKTRELVIETLDEGDLKVSDGMDIALCAIDSDSRMVQYAGANNSLYMIKNNSLHEIKPDKQPVGRYSNAKPFTNHVVRLEKGDQLYLFTDGMADQFGGPKGKKFKYKPFKNLLLQTSENTLMNQKNLIDQAFEDWKGNLDQVDDVCVVGVRL